MSAKHTSGPWGIEVTDSTNWIGPMRRDGRKIHEIVCHIDREDLKPLALETSDANARLIAAAPCLLEALESILQSECAILTDLRNRARAVIAKATGEGEA